MNDSKVRVSIGMPVYNGEAYVETALESLLSQTFTGFELFISDNASEDRTEEICREFAKKDPRITYTRLDRNLGAAANFNRVFRETSGEYFRWAAHDDVCAPTYLERCVAALDAHSDVVLSFPKTIYIDEDDRQHKRSEGALSVTANTPGARVRMLCQHQIRSDDVFWGVFGLARRRALETSPLIASFPASDQVLLLYLAILGRFEEVPEYLFYRRDHREASMIKHSTPDERAEWFDALASPGIRLPSWRCMYEHIRLLRRCELGLGESLVCYYQILRGYAHRWRVLGGDIKNAMLRLASRQDGRGPVQPSGEETTSEATRIRGKERKRSLRIALFGAAPDTGNLGVSALCYATLSSILSRRPRAQVTVFDHGIGTRHGIAKVGGTDRTFLLCGAYRSRRFYRSESLRHMLMAARLGFLPNAGVKLLAEADAVLDLTGGDSFTDLYGDWRFLSGAMTKQLALRLKKPLILLPQTIGPFRKPRNLRIARTLLLASSMVWVRDRRSLTSLEEILGRDFDRTRHRGGVDMAFGLEARKPRTLVPELISSWIQNRDSVPVVGINVSGLIYNEPELAAQRFGLKADYRHCVSTVVQRLLRESSANVVLFPHVLLPSGHESDVVACAQLAKEIPDDCRERVAVLTGTYDPSETKWIIAQLSWVCGTRMHSSIAALSSGVPSASISYSDKALGVFETCGQGGHVADPRSMDSETVVETVLRSWKGHTEARVALHTRLPEVLGQLDAQVMAILQLLSGVPTTTSSTRVRPPVEPSF